MKRKTLEINGKTFELFKSNLNETESFTNGAAYDEIYEAYGRPSNIKVSVWHEWCEWCRILNQNGIPCTLEIGSHSCQQFTIYGKVKFGGQVYGLRITRDHNRAYLIA